MKTFRALFYKHKASLLGKRRHSSKVTEKKNRKKTKRRCLKNISHC